jgi:single-stranded DNA-binding protein
MSIECAFFGSLARDAEAKVSKSGKNYLRLSVRVGDAEPQYVNVLCFDQQAIDQVDKLPKGSKVYVEGGGLKIDEWTGSDGAKRHGLSCMSWHCRVAEIGRNKPKREPKPSAPQARTDDLDDEVPF